MAWRNVIVNAWVPEQGPVDPGYGVEAPPVAPGPPPVVSPPIYYPPYPDQGLPGVPPGYWGGVAPPLPTHPIAPGGPPPVVSPPIYYPPSIWPDPGHPAHPIAPGGPPPTVSPPIYYPPSIWPDPGHPAHPIAPGGPPPVVSPPIYYPPYPDQGLPVPPPTVTHPIAPGGPPPGYWGGVAPPLPTHPIAPGGPPPGIWPSPGVPTHPIYLPPGTPPVIDIDDIPGHPEVPDLNAGNWIYVLDGFDYKRAFVPWPLAVTHPDYNPNYPEQGLPGNWVVIYYGQPTWAWIPTSGSTTPPNGGDAHPDHELPGDQPHPDHELPGDQPVVNPQ